MSGEFRDSATEHAFNFARFAENVRHGRWLLIASVILNSLFFISDWRFHGTAQFMIAIPARALVVFWSLASLGLLGRARTPRQASAVMAAWVAVTACGVTALVSSHSELALFVVLLLPLIVYLSVPLSFAATVLGGGGTSILLLAGYASQDAGPITGLAFALLTLNCALALVVARANRLRRLEWQATRTARAVAQELAISREVMEKIFAAAPVPMLVTRAEDGVVLQINHACTTMFGVPRDDGGILATKAFYADPRDRVRLMALLERDGQVTDFEMRANGADGRTRTVLIKAAMVEMAIGRAIIAGVIDISDRKAVELSLEWLASTDPLTKLPNRLSFFSTARAEMMRATRTGRPLALMMVDLDHFKAVNDTYGHHGGDQVLKAFGRICVERLRGTDIIGRLGGEEFGILVPNIEAADAVTLANELRCSIAALRLPAPLDTLRATASIGVTMVRLGDTHLDIPLARADQALYVAKRSGRDCVHIDDGELAATMQRSTG